MQEIKKKLRGRADIRVTKSVLVKHALENLGRKELKQLEEHINGSVALLVSNESPFVTFNFIKKNKAKVAAKPGQKTEREIVVPAGETDLPAGPALAELKMAKIDAKIEKGKIVIGKDSTVAKPGDVITPQIAAALLKLGILPMESGLNITVMLEKNIFYLPSVLNIDEEQFKQELAQAYQSAFNLAVFAAIATKETVPVLIQKAARAARAVSINSGFATPETVNDIIAKSARAASALEAELKSKGNKTWKKNRWKKMQYVYAALMLHSAKKEVNESNVKSVLSAAGVSADDAQVKALVASLHGVNIDDAIKQSAVVAAPAAPAAHAAPAKKEEKKEEAGKTEEEAASGLAALFG